MKWQTDIGLQERAGGYTLVVCLTVFAITKTAVCEALTERLTLNVSSTNQGAGILDSRKGEKGESTRISLLPDCGHNATCCLTLLLPSLPTTADCTP